MCILNKKIRRAVGPTGLKDGGGDGVGLVVRCKGLHLMGTLRRVPKDEGRGLSERRIFLCRSFALGSRVRGDGGRGREGNG